MDSNNLIKNKYKIIKELGHGAFGKVYEVEDITDNQHYAIKRLNKEDIFKNDYLSKAYWKELEVMKECECINSIKLIENFITTNNLNIVMELCDEDLEKYVNKHKQNIPEYKLKHIMSGLNNVFEIMNIKNIVHRDLKLKNIMIKYINNNNDNNNELNFIPKLCDFGFSKVLDEDITKTKLGTPSTMAPEIMMNKNYTNKCDIWSLGVIMYQILFKNLPFKARNEQEILKKILTTKGAFTIPDNFNDISKELKELLYKMMTVEPSNRISWKDYFEHPFFMNKIKDEELDKFENKYTPARKLSDENQGLYIISKSKNKITGEYVYVKEFDRLYIDSCIERKTIFDNEIKLMKRFNNKDKFKNYFVSLIDYYETKKYYYVVIEYFEGKLLDNYINSKKVLNDEVINKLIITIVDVLKLLKEENTEVENKINSLTTKSFWFKNYINESNFNLKLFDFGIAKLYNEKTFECSYNLNELLTEKRIVLSFGLILYKICFGFPLFNFSDNDDVDEITKKVKVVKVPKLIHTLLVKLLERSLHFKIDKRYTIDELVEDPYIKKIRIHYINIKNIDHNKTIAKNNDNNNSNNNSSSSISIYLSDFKVENLVDNLLVKITFVDKYLANLLGYKYCKKDDKYIKNNNEFPLINEYFINYSKEIAIFNILTMLEIDICIEFLKGLSKEESEIHIININKYKSNNNCFEYSYIKTLNSNLQYNLENPMIEELIKLLNKIKDNLYFLLNNLLKDYLSINLEEFEVFSYLQESIKELYLTSTENYFFALFEKGVDLFTHFNYKEAYSNILMSKFYYENLILFKIINNNISSNKNFIDLIELLEKEDTLNLNAECSMKSVHRKSIVNINNCITSSMFTSFLGGIFKSFKTKDIVENKFSNENKDNIDKIMSFYFDILSLLDQCQKSILQ